MTTEIQQFSGKLDRARIYLDVEVVRRKRWFATCNGFVASIPHPRTLELVEKAVTKVSHTAFADYWNDSDNSRRSILVECEVRGFEYLASTLNEIL